MNLKRGNIKIYLALFLICLVFFLFLGRSFQLQIIQHTELTRMGQALSKRDIDVEPVRGEIYDIDGTLLATSVKVYDLWVTQQDLHLDTMETAEEILAFQEHVKTLEEVLGITEDEFMAKATGPHSSFLVAGSINKETLDKLKEKWPPWLVAADSYKRIYPNGSVAPQVIGTTDSAGNGLAGIEKSYNDVLRGVNGKVLMETDLWGNQLAMREAKLYAPVNGSNIQTTLSVPKQYIVDQWVKKAYDDLKPEGSVTAILMKTKTGAIEAISSYPNFDLNNPRVLPPSKENETLTAEEYTEKLFHLWATPANLFIYEPGSISKVLTTAIGLETASFNMDTIFHDDDGMWEYEDGTILYCVAYPNSHGDQTTEEALVNSCNPAFIQMRRYIGIDNMYNYLEAFGLPYRLGMKIGDESFPWFLPRETLRQIEADTMAFGHGYSVTPLQMLAAVNAVINDGKLMQPRIVERMLTDEGDLIEEFSPKMVRQVISKDTSALMRKMMREVVTNVPYEMYFAVRDIGMGGKTGTTDLLEENEEGKLKKITSYFLAAPIDDPEYSLLFLVDRPTTDTHSYILVEYTAGILLDALRYDGYKGDNPDAYLVDVPNFIGLSDEQAELELKELDLKPIFVNYNEKASPRLIVNQYPELGAQVRSGATLILDFGDLSPKPVETESESEAESEEESD
jgi:stage V sporulation protein D (sporulation-specific penicillin-binding protein)